MSGSKINLRCFFQGGDGYIEAEKYFSSYASRSDWYTGCEKRAIGELYGGANVTVSHKKQRK